MKTFDSLLVEVRPMGLCFPGRLQSVGDARLRAECAPLWRDRLLAHMPDQWLTWLVGAHAQSDALGPGKMTERVMGFRNYLPPIFPLPHPSWLMRHEAARNPWFDADMLPAQHSAVQRALA